MIQCTSIDPHTWGVLSIPAKNWKTGDSLDLKFYLKDQWLVDEFLLPITILSDTRQNERADNSTKVELPAPIAKDSKAHIGKLFGKKVFKTIISKSVRLEESPAYKESIFTFAPDSKGAKEYQLLSEEILKNV